MDLYQLTETTKNFFHTKNRSSYILEQYSSAAVSFRNEIALLTKWFRQHAQANRIS